MDFGDSQRRYSLCKNSVIETKSVDAVVSVVMFLIYCKVVRINIQIVIRVIWVQTRNVGNTYNSIQSVDSLLIAGLDDALTYAPARAVA